MPFVARLGDQSDHGGVIISVTTQYTNAEGKLVARVTDLHSCPIPGHGITPILTGSGNFFTEGHITAVDGSVCGCGAKIIASATKTAAPLEVPTNAGTFGGPTTLGPSSNPFKLA